MHRPLLFFLSERYLNSEGPNTNSDFIMMAEFSVVPIGVGESLSTYVAECLKIIKKSGLRYQLTPMGTILEGDFHKVLDTIGQCHLRVRSMSDRVTTTIRLDDRETHTDEMLRKVKSVEEKMGT